MVKNAGIPALFSCWWGDKEFEEKFADELKVG